MGNTAPVTFPLAFIAGFLTFASPCIFPLIPAYISYITGISFNELKEAKSSDVQLKTLIHSLFFVLGFSAVFISLGASASLLGKIILAYRVLLSRIGGVLVILFGLYIMGVFRISALDREKRIEVKLQKGSKLGSFLLGVTFAAAWTPCVGPILGSILIYAGTRDTMLEGILLLTSYSLGVAIPFMISAFLVNSLIARIAQFNKYLSAVKYICGVLLVLMGILLVTNHFGMIRW
ncbi:MAG: cytochrome c biogenesis protein CcdA [Candidatus Omnitrophica bacterium]|nr:cytochrome c biogenesis protein CcdA [Candidatus Omnitrophota bacterium]